MEINLSDHLQLFIVLYNMKNKGHPMATLNKYFITFTSTLIQGLGSQPQQVLDDSLAHLPNCSHINPLHYSNSHHLLDLWHFHKQHKWTMENSPLNFANFCSIHFILLLDSCQDCLRSACLHRPAAQDSPISWYVSPAETEHNVSCPRVACPRVTCHNLCSRSLHQQFSW